MVRAALFGLSTFPRNTHKKKTPLPSSIFAARRLRGIPRGQKGKRLHVTKSDGGKDGKDFNSF